ncbi:permease [Paenibacillus apiarius]|uniref:permease n=1 Tax=Paenibacillus apiarius TaxID=46240 RepID=UPI0019821B7E|nr:permease [Paenibacillus apiarius]MBN3523464.1 permease [Paenibacillus apiarius]
MMFSVMGFAGNVLIALGLLAKTLSWITSKGLFIAVIFFGFILFGIAESKWGRRHVVVRSIDYLPLMACVILYALAQNESVKVAAIVLLLPLGAISSWIAVRLSKTKKYRSIPRIDETKNDPPKFQ